jgi:hypothetical protein
MKEVSRVSMRPRGVDCLAVLTHGLADILGAGERRGLGNVLRLSRSISSDNWRWRSMSSSLRIRTEYPNEYGFPS